jgi:hypothetical protein
MLLTGLRKQILWTGNLCDESTSNASPPAMANIHQDYRNAVGKIIEHLFITHPETGKATNRAIMISFRKSFDNSDTMAASLAPSTLRILFL